jgi:hypothetical protein
MFIKINDEYAIESEEECWAVKLFNSPSKQYSEGYWRAKTYHRTFEEAVSSLARRMIRFSGAVGLVDAIKEAQVISCELKSALDPLYKVEEL